MGDSKKSSQSQFLNWLLLKLSREKRQQKTSQTDGHPLKTASLMKILHLPLASLGGR